MNNNDKTNKTIEIDDKKIKSHLNASLDFSGISVSEDLINRTLEAINKQPAEQPLAEDSSKKVIAWNRYIRAFAGVAAAVIVVVVGYGLAGNGLLFNKSAKNSTDSGLLANQKYDMTTNEESAQEGEIYSTTMDAAPRFSIAADTFTADAGEGATGSTGANESTGSTGANESTGSTGTNESTGSTGETTSGENSLQAEQPAQKATSSSEEAILTFRDIFLADPAQAESIVITDETSGTSITLASREEILDFYAVMDNHQFTYSSSSSAATNYTVEIKSPRPKEAIYDMIIGDNIVVTYTDSEISSQSIYSAVDQILLIQNLQDFYQKYHK